MKNFIKRIFSAASPEYTQMALAFLRIGIGALTIPHGYPKMMGGQQGWEQIGIMFMYPFGIYFLPMAWGFVAAVTEFVGGIALVLGLGTRIAAFFLTIMMAVATAWHLMREDGYNVYSFPLTLIFVFLTFVLVGGGSFSVDGYLTGGKKTRTRRKRSPVNKEEKSVVETTGTETEKAEEEKGEGI
jgi:putative oxidoreductase